METLLLSKYVDFTMFFLLLLLKYMYANGWAIPRPVYQTKVPIL